MVLLAAEPETSDPLVGPLRDHGFEIAGPGTRADVVIAGAEAEVERLSADAPVILLGGVDDAPIDRVLAFQRGCDDYVPPPFHHEELVARIRAVLRRRQPRTELLRIGELVIDRAARRVVARGVDVFLSAKEYALLLKLASDPERVFTREQLLRDVWGYRGYFPTRTLESHASRVRCKLAAAGLEGWVVNIWGVGYKLRPVP
jgi:DNA-binding response OmpR family regulator